MCTVTFDWRDSNAKKKFTKFDSNHHISWAIIDITNLCNYNCKWCFSDLNEKTKGMHMAIADLEKILVFLKKEGIKQITYSGGEPTLYPNLLEAIKLAKKNDFIVHLNSNGYLLDENYVQALAREGLSQIQLNIESLDEKKHNSIRGAKNAFLNASRAIESIINNNISCVVASVITKDNYEEITCIMDFARQKGVDRYRVWNMLPSFGIARTNTDVLLNNYFDILQEVTNHAKNTGAKFIEIGDPLFNPFIKTNLSYNGGYCVFSKGMVIYISVNGDVYFCGTFRKNMYNIYDVIDKNEELNSIHQQAIKKYTDKYPMPENCKNCNDNNSCKGGCITRRDFTNEKIDYLCKYCLTEQIAN